MGTEWDSEFWEFWEVSEPWDSEFWEGSAPDYPENSDDQPPITRIELIRAVHLVFAKAFQGMGRLVHPKKTKATLGPVMPGAATLQARFEIAIHSDAPAFQHYGAAAISVAVPYDSMGNREWVEGIGTKPGSYPTCVEVVPKHTSGSLFNAFDETITHPMLDDSIVRFHVSFRPYPYGESDGDLVIHPRDAIRIFDWVREFVAHTPAPAPAPARNDDPQ